MMATNVVNVGLAIQAAMIRQRGILEQTRETNKFYGEIIASNAVSVKRHTEEIGDLYSNPVIALDKIAKAQDDLIAALDTAVQHRRDGLAKANDHVAQLSKLTDDFRSRVANSLGHALPESGQITGHLQPGGRPDDPASRDQRP